VTDQSIAAIAIRRAKARAAEAAARRSSYQARLRRRVRFPAECDKSKNLNQQTSSTAAGRPLESCVCTYRPFEPLQSQPGHSAGADAHGTPATQILTDLSSEIRLSWALLCRTFVTVREITSHGIISRIDRRHFARYTCPSKTLLQIDPRQGMLNNHGCSTFVRGIRLEESLAAASENLSHPGRNHDGHRSLRGIGGVLASIRA